jgi:hypothetical protein
MSPETQPVRKAGNKYRKSESWKWTQQERIKSGRMDLGENIGIKTTLFIEGKPFIDGIFMLTIITSAVTLAGGDSK